MAWRFARQGGGAVLALVALACSEDFTSGTTGPSGTGGTGGGADAAGGAGGAGASAVTWSAPESLGDVLDDPSGIATDLTRVYVADTGARAIVHIAKEGGATGTLAADQEDARYVAVAGTEVAWTASKMHVGCSGDPWQAALLAGDPATAMFELYAMCSRPTGALEAYGNEVYWIHDALFHATAPSGNYALLVDGAARPEALAIDVTHVYFVNNDGGLGRVAKGGGLVEPIDELAAGVAVTAGVDAVYVATDEGEIMSYDKTSKGAPTAIASGQAGLVAMASDDEWVVWAGSGASAAMGFIGAARMSDAAVVTIAEDQATPVDVTIDKDGIYWTNGGTGQVMVSWRADR